MHIFQVVNGLLPVTSFYIVGIKNIIKTCDQLIKCIIEIVLIVFIYSCPIFLKRMMIMP